MESLGEVPVALVEKGKGPGSHLLSGAMMKPSAMRKLFPDLDESDWPTYGHDEQGHRLPAAEPKRAIPLKPTPPPFRNHGNHVTSVAQLGRWLVPAGRGGRRLHPRRDLGPQAARGGRERGRRALGRQGPRPRRRGASNFEPGSDLIAKATVLRRGHGRPSDRRGHPPLRPRLRGPAAVGARREGDLGGPAAARPRDPHDGLAAQVRREVPRVRRLASSIPWARTGSRWASWWASTTRTRASRCTTRSRS